VKTRKKLRKQPIMTKELRKSRRVQVRITESLYERISKASMQTGIDISTVMESCLTSYVSYVEKTGEMSFPIAVAPASEARAKSVKPSSSSK
jgi:hypothetical protein